MSGRDDHIERLHTGELELGITDALQKYAYPQCYLYSR